MALGLENTVAWFKKKSSPLLSNQKSISCAASKPGSGLVRAGWDGGHWEQQPLPAALQFAWHDGPNDVHVYSIQSGHCDPHLHHHYVARKVAFSGWK